VAYYVHSTLYVLNIHDIAFLGRHGQHFDHFRPFYVPHQPWRTRIAAILRSSRRFHASSNSEIRLRVVRRWLRSS